MTSKENQNNSTHHTRRKTTTASGLFDFNRVDTQHVVRTRCSIIFVGKFRYITTSITKKSFLLLKLPVADGVVSIAQVQAQSLWCQSTTAVTQAIGRQFGKANDLLHFIEKCFHNAVLLVDGSAVDDDDEGTQCGTK